MTRSEAYNILGLSYSADEKEVRRAYRDLIKKYHPEENPEEWKRVHDAYACLKEMGKGAFVISDIDGDARKITTQNVKSNQVNKTSAYDSPFKVVDEKLTKQEEKEDKEQEIKDFNYILSKLETPTKSYGRFVIKADALKDYLLNNKAYGDALNKDYLIDELRKFFEDCCFFPEAYQLLKDSLVKAQKRNPQYAYKYEHILNKIALNVIYSDQLDSLGRAPVQKEKSKQFYRDIIRIVLIVCVLCVIVNLIPGRRTQNNNNKPNESVIKYEAFKEIMDKQKEEMNTFYEEGGYRGALYYYNDCLSDEEHEIQNKLIDECEKELETIFADYGTLPRAGEGKQYVQLILEDSYVIKNDKVAAYFKTPLGVKYNIYGVARDEYRLVMLVDEAEYFNNEDAVNIAIYDEAGEMVATKILIGKLEIDQEKLGKAVDVVTGP